MSRRSKIFLIIGGLTVVATIAIFAVVHPDIFPSTILGLCFVIYAEGVLFGGIAGVEIFSKRSSSLISWSGIGVTAGIYSAVVFVSSLIFMFTRTVHVSWFLVLQLVMFVIALSVCLVIAGFSVSTKKKENGILLAGATIQNMQDRLILLSENFSHKSEINGLAEELRYSDTSVSVDADVEIDEAISHLEELSGSDDASEEECEKAVKNIRFLIKKRNLQAKALKQGRI